MNFPSPLPALFGSSLVQKVLTVLTLYMTVTAGRVSRSGFGFCLARLRLFPLRHFEDASFCQIANEFFGSQFICKGESNESLLADSSVQCRYCSTLSDLPQSSAHHLL